jgi:hypothetical protein
MSCLPEKEPGSQKAGEAEPPVVQMGQVAEPVRADFSMGDDWVPSARYQGPVEGSRPNVAKSLLTLETAGENNSYATSMSSAFHTTFPLFLGSFE